MTALSDKMRLRADADDLPVDHPVRGWADKFDAVDMADTKKFIGTWAKTRRIWCEYSGENLI